MLTGFGISGFRSYGPDPQFVAPLSKINVFVGQNNVGKSNLLRVVELAALAGQGNGEALKKALKSDDAHDGKRAAPLKVFLPIPFDEVQLACYIDGIAGRLRGDVKASVKASLAAAIQALPHQDEVGAWFTYGLNDSKLLVEAPSFDDFKKEGDLYGGQSSRFWTQIWSHVTGNSGGGIREHWIPETVRALSPSGRTPAGQVHYVEAHRKIGQPGTAFEGFSGQGMIGRLLELQSPKSTVRTANKAKFNAINSFLKSVSGDPDAHIEVDGGATELMVNVRGVVRPVQSLGTGIHEVVILAVAATSVDGAIMCIEEPEIHLHPRIQRRLMQFLAESTSNQYFISTHSAHLLDCPGAALFHLRLNEHQETVVESLNAERRAAACFDLGYRASDLVQANCIVWVEGPSDRSYINAWVSMGASDLKEGLHYSIMFYGGKLLSHLTVSNEEVTEFIELQRLNRNVAVVMDSDKGSDDDTLGHSKQRVADEVTRHGGFAWVTAGREIENYVPEPVMKAALSAVHPMTEFKQPSNQWSCAYRSKGASAVEVSKPRIAKACAPALDLDMLDLRQRVEALIAFIRQSNA
jgi:predicted ATPase